MPYQYYATYLLSGFFIFFVLFLIVLVLLNSFVGFFFQYSNIIIKSNAFPNVCYIFTCRLFYAVYGNIFIVGKKFFFRFFYVYFFLIIFFIQKNKTTVLVLVEIKVLMPSSVMPIISKYCKIISRALV